MKKILAFALASSMVFASLPVSAATHGGHDGAKKHPIHTKSHKMHTKSGHKMHTKAATHKAHIKALPKTGMGGASETIDE